MANREETYSPAFNTVFVQTSIDTRLAILAHIHDTISDFRENLYKEHKHCYPEVGDINISALKVLREGYYYRLPDSMNMNKVFVGLSTEKWFLYVDVERVENGELMAIMPADQNPELLDKNEVAIDSVLVDGHTTIEEGLENKVVEKKKKKRKIESSGGKKSRKKSKVNLSQSAVADKSLELGGNVQVEVAMTESLVVSPRAKSDDIQGITNIASGEKNVISMGENQQTSDADMLWQEKSITNHGKEPSEKLDDLAGAMEQDLGEGENTAGLDNIDQEKELAPTSRDDLTESHEACAEVQVGVTPEHCDTLPREKLDDVLPEATEKDIGRDEGSSLAKNAVENQLEASSGMTTGPATEKKRKRKKSSKDDINQSTAAASTTSRKTVDEINGVPENEMAEKIDDDAENQLGSSSGLISGTATEKKKKRKKSSKDHINESTAAATTISREVVNEREEVFDHVDTTSEVIPNSRSEKLVNALEETIQNENEMGSKVVDKVGSIEATPNGADEIQAKDNVHVADLTTTLPALVEASKRSLEHEGAKDNGELDAVEAKSVKSTKKKKSRKTKTLNGADEIQAEDNVQVAALVEESKTLDNIGKFTDDKRTLVDEVAKDNGDEAKSVKPTKKKKSRKTKTPAMEDTLVDSGPQNVEPLKVVDGEGPDNVIRSVLDSLHQRNKIQESLDIVEKKASKRSKKRLSSNIVDSQVLSVEVNNATQESVPLISNPEDTDALDPYLSQQTQREKADMGDNFGSRQKDGIVVGAKKQDKVAGEAKPKKEKKSLDLRPCGSIDGSLSSMKPKERNSRAQPASSGSSQMMSRLKNDRTGSKVDDSITSVKKSSNSLTVNKNKLNFFKDAEEWNSSDDESKRTPPPHVSTRPSPDNSSTKSPPDSSSDHDSDVTSMSRKQGNNLPGGAFKFSGSLQDILRSSRSYKKAKEMASQYRSDDETPALDFVPESQA